MPGTIPGDIGANPTVSMSKLEVNCLFHLCQSRVVNCVIVPSMLHALHVCHVLIGILLAYHARLVVASWPLMHNTHPAHNIASLLSTCWAALPIIGHAPTCTHAVYQPHC